MNSILRRTAWIGGVLLVLLLLAAWWIVRASRSVPDFYRQALDAEPAARAEASDRMLQRASVLVSDVRQPGEWSAVFSEDEINGWLAVDLVENHADAIPDGVSQPRVDIESGRLSLGVRYQDAHVDTILSATTEAFVADTGELGLRLCRVRAGSLPVPKAKLLSQVDDAAEQFGWPVRWQEIDGDPVALIRVRLKEQDGRAARLESISLEDDAVFLSGTTE